MAAGMDWAAAAGPGCVCVHYSYSVRALVIFSACIVNGGGCQLGEFTEMLIKTSLETHSCDDTFIKTSLESHS